MRIIDKNNNEILHPDLSRGYLRNDRIFVKHHEAVEPVEEKWHYETVAEYPNGGKDVRKVIDVAGVKAKEAWDEYEEIQRYVEHTAEFLIDREKKAEERLTIHQRLDRLERLISQLIDAKEGV